MARQSMMLEGEKKTLEASAVASSRNSLKAKRVLGEEEASGTSEARTADSFSARFRANGHGMGNLRAAILANWLRAYADSRGLKSGGTQLHPSPDREAP
jgi:hypothetical protein